MLFYRLGVLSISACFIFNPIFAQEQLDLNQVVETTILQLATQDEQQPIESLDPLIEDIIDETTDQVNEEVSSNYMESSYFGEIYWIKDNPVCKKNIITVLALDAFYHSLDKLHIFKDSLQNAQNQFKNPVKKLFITKLMRKQYRIQLIERLSNLQTQWSQLTVDQRNAKGNFAVKLLKDIKTEFHRVDAESKRLIRSNKNLFLGELLINLCEQTQFLMTIEPPLDEELNEEELESLDF